MPAFDQALRTNCLPMPKKHSKANYFWGLSVKHTLAKTMTMLPFLALKMSGFVGALWCFVLAGVVLLICLADDSQRPERTPRYAIYVRLTIMTLLFAVPGEWLIQTSLGYPFVGYWGAILAAYGASLALVLLYLIFHGIIEALFLANDPQFQKLKRRGFSFFWDNLPEFLNPDNDPERETGLREPEYSWFVPPRTWLYQCPRCGARVAQRIDVCWNC